MTSNEGKSKKKKKLIKKTMAMANQIVNKNEEGEMNFIDIQIQLSKLDKTAALRIACSDSHALVSTNTGSVFAWGKNDSM